MIRLIGLKHVPTILGPPSFYVEYVVAGSRIGWRWTNAVSGGLCETVWLETLNCLQLMMVIESTSTNAGR